MKRVIIVFLVIPFGICQFCLAELVPFVIPSQTNPESKIIFKSNPIKPNAQRLTAEEHFYLGRKPIRLWGVNLSFGANLPSHEDAPHIAQRLAWAGINSVRLHHMDTANFPRGIWNPDKPTELDTRALDRLDFFIDQLAKNGIYVNLNLHVGRTYSKILNLPETKRNYDKVFNIFTPQLVQSQKKYAKDILSHVNPYRNRRYADDSAIAIVEITNENSFFMWDGDQTLRSLPEYYEKILQQQYNKWLKDKYLTTEKLRNTWAKDTEPLGNNFLANSALTIEPDNSVPKTWRLEQHNQCKAQVSNKTFNQTNALLIEPTRIDNTSWHLQLNQTGITLKQDKYYTVTFKAAAQMDRPLSCGIGQAHEPWNNLGLSRQVNLTTDWQSFQFGFTANAGDDNARINFTFGTDDTPFYLADIQLKPGGRQGLLEDEAIEKISVRLFAESEVKQRSIDRMLFLAETEKAYFDDMRNFIKKDLSCNALVTGTIVFGPLGLYAQSDMDFIDTHAYWKHPNFPGRPWDAGNWIVEQKAMTDNPDEAPIFNLAASRLFKKPFTVTEYNHPAPNDYQAECVPMISAFAAIQDWDGVWLYTYSHSSDQWDRKHLNSYFDIDTNPSKWGFVPAAASIFREKTIYPPGRLIVQGISESKDVLLSLAQQHLKYDRNMLHIFEERFGYNDGRIFPNILLNHQPLWMLTHIPHHYDSHWVIPRTSWHIDENGKGLFSVESQGARVYTGHAELFKDNTEGKVKISEPQFAAITITALDTNQFKTCKKILITACGRCENTGMKFSEDRRTVGRNWGTAPVMIETVKGSIKLPEGKWKCVALGPDGLARTDVPIDDDMHNSIIELLPEYKTMWYLLSRIKE